MPFKTSYAEFTSELYERRSNLFWMLPARLTDPSSDLFLARLYEAGGYGLTDVLPVIALAALGGGNGLPRAFALEQVGRLCGRDPSSINTRAIKKLNLASLARSKRGKRVTTWAEVHPGLSNLPDSPTHTPNYFFFPYTMLDGGHWAMLTSAQRLIYLALATHARTLDVAPADMGWLPTACRAGLGAEDLQTCFATGPRRGEIRLAGASPTDAVSYTALSEMTGLSRSVVIAAVNGLKSCDVWGPQCRNDALVLWHTPIWAYPPAAHGESVWYCFRDHVEHWPWDIMNRPDGTIANVRKATAGTLEPPPDWLDDGDWQTDSRSRSESAPSQTVFPSLVG